MRQIARNEEAQRWRSVGWQPLGFPFSAKPGRRLEQDRGLKQASGNLRREETFGKYFHQYQGNGKTIEHRYKELSLGDKGVVIPSVLDVSFTSALCLVLWDGIKNSKVTDNCQIGRHFECTLKSA